MGPAQLAAYDAIVFDCDGVLLDSNAMKTSAFRQTLADAGCTDAVAQRFSAHQQVNFGVSRHRLFGALLAGQFGEGPPGTDLDTLLRRFGVACVQGYLRAPVTAGALALLEALRGRALYVVSGSDESELRAVFGQRGLAEHFRQVYGSPATKLQNLQRVRGDLHADGLPSRRLVFLGDAHADADAARDGGCDFIFVAGYSTVRDTLSARVAAEGGVMMETLRGLLGPGESLFPPLSPP